MKIVTGKEFLKMPEPVLYTYLGDIPEYGCDLLDDNILRVKTYNHTDTDYYVSCALVDLNMKVVEKNN